MRYALGSNRAEYGRVRELRTLIQVGLSVKGLSIEEIRKVKLPKKLVELQSFYTELCRQLRSEGKMK